MNYTHLKCYNRFMKENDKIENFILYKKVLQES